MEKRRLGRSELEVAPFALGGNVFGWTIDEKQSFEVLNAFVDSGFNFIDTADVYSNWHPGNKGGESETIIGSWMKQKKNRNRVIIATKAGGDMGSGKNLRKKYILKAVEDSLKRLQTDHIDLYQAHFDDTSIPVEEPLEAFAQLIQDGKVRVAGASNFSNDRLEEALKASARNGFPRYESFQPRYNLYDREEYEKNYQQLCVDNEVGVIPYYGLASGFLTGKYRSEADLSKSARGGGIKKYLDARGKKILSALDEVAAANETQPATIALAWLMSRPGITAPIASATSPAQLQQLTKATTILLAEKDLMKLDTASK